MYSITKDYHNGSLFIDFGDTLAFWGLPFSQTYNKQINQAHDRKRLFLVDSKIKLFKWIYYFHKLNM